MEVAVACLMRGRGCVSFMSISAKIPKGVKAMGWPQTDLRTRCVLIAQEVEWINGRQGKESAWLGVKAMGDSPCVS